MEYTLKWTGRTQCFHYIPWLGLNPAYGFPFKIKGVKLFLWGLAEFRFWAAQTAQFNLSELWKHKLKFSWAVYCTVTVSHLTVVLWVRCCKSIFGPDGFIHFQTDLMRKLLQDLISLYKGSYCSTWWYCASCFNDLTNQLSLVPGGNGRNQWF